MSVRRVKRRDPATGVVREFFMVDVDYQHPDGRRERIRKVAPVQTGRGAEQYERELRFAIADGTFRSQEVEEVAVPPTVNEFAVEFLRYARTNNKPSEVVAKEVVLRRHFAPTIGKLRLDQVDARIVERYKSQKTEEELSPKTINNHLAVLTKMLALAVEWKLIPSMPRVRWLKVPPPSFDFLSFEEAERLVAGANGMWRTMIVVAIKTGLRQGELLALRWEDIDLVAGRLMVRRSVNRGFVSTPKSGKPREVALGEIVRRTLKAERHLRGELVFCDEGGAMLTAASCVRPLWRACQRAGLRHIRWHALRHTFASHLVMRGVPLKAVQELLGHSTMDMTMRYAHLAPAVDREAVSTLDLPAYGNLTATEGGGEINER
jgi:integrase